VGTVPGGLRENDTEAHGNGDGNERTRPDVRYMQSHRSLAVWRLSHDLCVSVLKTVDSHYHPRARALFDHLRRAAISVETNVVEGYALGTDPLFRRHLRIALGSAAEVEMLLETAQEVGYLPKDTVRVIQQKAARALRVIFGLMRNLGGKWGSRN